MAPLTLAVLLALGARAELTPPVKPEVAVSSVPARRPRRAEVALSTVPITVIYPGEGHAMDFERGQFILGSVSHPRRPFRINGSTVTPHAKGGFLAYLPIQAGSFAFRCELDLPEGTTVLTRVIQVRDPAPTPAVDSLAIAAATVQPSHDLELGAGDWVHASMRGTPGLSAAFSVGGHARLPMAETQPGLYEGAYRLTPFDRFARARIRVSLSRGSRSARAEAAGRLSSPAVPATAVVRPGAAVNVRSSPEGGFILFPPPGTRLLATGRDGAQTRVELAAGLSGWVETRQVDMAPAGTPPPRGVLGTIGTETADGATVVRLALGEKVPFAVEEAGDLGSLTLRLFHTTGRVNWVVYDPADAFIEEVRWKQADSGTALVTVRLAPGRRLWGYEASWQDRALKLVLRHPPRIAPAPASVFSGRTIALDPGHTPGSHGAVGPLGTLEMDANLWIARELEALLAVEGAKVLLTRQEGQDAALAGRPRQAAQQNADLFVSVHNNALPDGEDPFVRPRGYSVFYYHPHSLALARAVYRSYGKRAPLPGEGLRYGNLYVARMTQMPSILTESAYLIVPEQEQMLLEPARRRTFVVSILEGLRAFLKEERARQAAAPAQAKPRRKKT